MGYVPESLGAFGAFAFEALGMNRVCAEVLPKNGASLEGIIKNGISAGALVSRRRPNFGDTVLMLEMWLNRVGLERSADE